MTSIVILTFNQIEYTKLCVESIARNTSVSHEIIFVDNGSTDGTVDWLRALVNGNPHYRLIENSQNLGFARGCNQGMAVASGTYLLLLNNDTVVTPGWLDQLIACAERKPQIGIVGPMSNYVSGPQLVQDIHYDPDSLDGLDAFARDYSYRHMGQTVAFQRVVGFCMLIKRAVVERIGGLDGRYGLGNFEDDDFVLRAALVGFESWIAQDCFIHHFGNRTFIGASIDYSESLLKNWEVFKKKWRIPPEVPYGGHHIIDLDRGFIPAEHYCPLNGTEERHGLPADGFRGKPQPAQRLVSIIIPTFNGLTHTKNCLFSIRAHTSESHEIIFVDNASADGTTTFLESLGSTVTKVYNSQNLGFARACNQGAREASGRFLLFLNNDTVVTSGWLGPLLDIIQKPGIGIVGCKLLYPNGLIQHAGISQIDGNPIHLHRDERADAPETCSIREMDMVTGACLMVSRELFFSLGGFDETFLNGQEDVDFCLRVREAGYKVIYQPQTVIYHHEAQSTGRFDHASENIAILIGRWKDRFGADGRFRASAEPRRIPSLRSLLKEGPVRTGYRLSGDASRMTAPRNLSPQR